MSQTSRGERRELMAEYHARISGANNEAVKKEIFIHLLSRLFPEDKSGIIGQFTAGAEKAVCNISREGRASGFGRADTQFGSVIIEFEHNLAKTGVHAEEQLKEYVSGNWNSGIQSRFTLIATDCLEWRVYTLDYNSLRGLGKLRAEDLTLERTRTFKADPKRADDFYYFLDRYLFNTEPVAATLDEIRGVFGYGTDIFQAAMIKMGERFSEIKNTPAMRAATTQWASFLKVAYGKFENDERIFLIHSYLSVLAKMLVYIVMTGDEFIDDSEMADILNGDFFRRKNIENFTDDDFFRWTAGEAGDAGMKEAYRHIAQALARFDFRDISEDILKGVYQELVDDDTRHSLGEHYTPDWLCAKIVEELAPSPDRKILDPSCGSGSFLKACANYLAKNHPEISAEELNACLYGIDVHPLSAQIAKATLLMAYGKKLASVAKPLRLNVFLANTLLLQREEAQLMGNVFKLSIDQKPVDIPATVFRDQTLFPDVARMAEIMAMRDFRGGKETDAEKAKGWLARWFGGNNAGVPLKDIQTAGITLYRAFLAAKKAGSDSIWVYVVTNNYAPLRLAKYFDIVVGNPPWLTFRDVAVKDYQDEIETIARRSGVLPEGANLRAQLDLASVFLGHCLDHFLKDDGILAFVMPRSVFVSDQHQNIRLSKVKNMELKAVWDLEGVNPLFNVPACALFCKRETENNGIRKVPAQLPCRVFSGSLGSRNSDGEKLSIKKNRLFLSRLNDRTAWSVGIPIRLNGATSYLGKFRTGGKLFPRVLCFVDIDQDFDGNFKNRELRIKSAEAINRDAKTPWKNIHLKGSISSRFIFRTVLARNVVPFALNGSFLVALPVKITPEGPCLEKIEAIENAGDLVSAQWFEDAEKQWEKYRTEKNSECGLADQYNWQNTLESQETNRRYLVMYNTSGTNVCGLCVDRTTWDLPFIANVVTYQHSTDNRDEAFYLCSYLNSSISNSIIKPFQTKGLQGERDICKKILEIPLPEFDAANREHRLLAELASEASRKSASYLEGKNLGPQGGNLDAGALGRLRGEVRSQLSGELKEIDCIWEKLLLGK